MTFIAGLSDWDLVVNFERLELYRASVQAACPEDSWPETLLHKGDLPEIVLDVFEPEPQMEVALGVERHSASHGALLPAWLRVECVTRRDRAHCLDPSGCSGIQFATAQTGYWQLPPSTMRTTRWGHV